MKVEWLKPSQIIHDGWYWLVHKDYNWVHLEYIQICENTGVPFYRDDEYDEIELNEVEELVAICDKPLHPIFNQ